MPQTAQQDILDKAEALFNRGAFEQATALCVQALQQDKNNADAYGLIASISHITGDLARADKFFKLAHDLDPHNIRALRYLGGKALRALQFQAARDYFETAYTLAPQDPENAQLYASVLERLNALDQAYSIATQALESAPDYEPLLLVTATIFKRRKDFKAALGLLDRIKSDNEITAGIISFERGICYDALGGYDEAFNSLEAAQSLKIKVNSDKGHLPDKTAFLNEIEQAKALYTSQNITNWGALPAATGITPHFFFGFPRSGTTLMQQMLDAHPQINCYDEISALRDMTSFAAQRFGDSADALANLPEDAQRLCADHYFKRAALSRAVDADKVFIDKLPFGIANMGLALRIFPDARFIIGLRHPCDCILSCLMQNFNLNSAMANLMTLEDAVHVYDQVMELLEQLIALPLDIKAHFVRYEDVIADPKTQVAGVLDFLDVPWDESVLHYRETLAQKEAIKTPSYHQVVQPLYKTAQYRWENYRAHFQPFMDQLAPWIEKYGYSA